MKGFKIIVLAKQVPDTRNVGKDAMKANGTVNRAALAAVFNPEDLKALEQALRIKDKNPGTTVTLLTMGPGRAAEIIREGLYRGADSGILITDRKFAGSDTLATSYAISLAVKKEALESPWWHGFCVNVSSIDPSQLRPVVGPRTPVSCR